MRIAYLSIGGHIHTERWLRYFVERGHEAHLLTVQPSPIEGVRVHDIRTGIPLKPLHYAVALRRVRRILAEIRPDVPPELSAIVSRMIRRDPAERYQTAAGSQPASQMPTTSRSLLRNDSIPGGVDRGYSGIGVGDPGHLERQPASVMSGPVWLRPY